MFTLACEQVFHFCVRKCQPIKTLIRRFYTCEKNRTNQSKRSYDVFSHVKNKGYSEIRILFQPNTTRKSLHSYNEYLCYTVYLLKLEKIEIV